MTFVTRILLVSGLLAGLGSVALGQRPTAAAKPVTLAPGESPLNMMSLKQVAAGIADEDPSVRKTWADSATWIGYSFLCRIRQQYCASGGDMYLFRVHGGQRGFDLRSSVWLAERNGYIRQLTKLDTTGLGAYLRVVDQRLSQEQVPGVRAALVGATQLLLPITPDLSERWVTAWFRSDLTFANAFTADNPEVLVRVHAAIDSLASLACIPDSESEKCFQLISAASRLPASPSLPRVPSRLPMILRTSRPQLFYNPNTSEYWARAVAKSGPEGLALVRDLLRRDALGAAGAPPAPTAWDKAMRENLFDGVYNGKELVAPLIEMYAALDSAGSAGLANREGRAECWFIRNAGLPHASLLTAARPSIVHLVNSGGPCSNELMPLLAKIPK